MIPFDLFLKQIGSAQSITDLFCHPVICFTGLDEPPSLFFDYFFSYLKTTAGISLESLQADNYELMCTRLQTLYWESKTIFRVTHTETSSNEKLYAYLSSYEGPHTVFLFLPSTLCKKYAKKKNWQVIVLPEKVDQTSILKLYLFFSSISYQFFELFVKKMVMHYPSCTVNVALQLLSYALFLSSKNVDLFFKQLAPKLVPSEYSLFSLSQDFFSQNSKAFFTKWLHMHEKYSPSFWISYWSNQLWHAHMYVLAMQKNGVVAGADRYIPYRFKKSDWRKYVHTNRLQNAHQQLVAADRLLKTTTHSYALELFFMQFFAA